MTVVGSDLLIVNGGGLEGTLLQVVQNAGGHERVVVASQGLKPRTPRPGEPGYGQALVVDPHWWLDPLDVVTYVANIRDAFVAADPAHAAVYRANAAAYIVKLKALDAWIRGQIATIPPANRVLVMNHLSHGYYADRYGFRVAGAVIPSVSSGETVSAKQMADLVKTIEAQHVKAIFVELDENPGLADQIAAEAHVKVITDLLDHSLSTAGGPAPTYLAMMRYDTQRHRERAALAATSAWAEGVPSTQSPPPGPRSRTGRARRSGCGARCDGPPVALFKEPGTRLHFE